MAAVQQKLEQLSQDYSTKQTLLTNNYSSRSTLENQLQENLLVQQEFSKLKDDAKIYKLTGPILLPNDLTDAKSNVEKRLDFIKSEIERVESLIEQGEKDLDELKIELVKARGELGA